MTWFPAPGDSMEPEALVLDRAQEVREALAWSPCTRLIETRQWASGDRYEEVLVVEIAPELPQDLVHDIRSQERLALGFERGDRRCPRVLALRIDFPHVPHLYSTPTGEPRWLCLYEDPWAEVRLRWSGAGFLRDIAQWLSRTAVGELHGADQPLEPFLLSGLDVVVFPEAVFAEDSPPRLYVATGVAERPDRPVTFKLEAADENQPSEANRMYVVVVVGQPTVHGAIHDSP